MTWPTEVGRRWEGKVFSNHIQVLTKALTHTLSPHMLHHSSLTSS